MRSKDTGQVIVADIFGELRGHIAKKYGTNAKAAEALGINATSLSSMLAGRRPIAAALLADAGIEAVAQPVQYVRIERRRNQK